MNQRGFINIVLIILVVVLVGTLIYVIFKKNSDSIGGPQLEQSSDVDTEKNKIFIPEEYVTKTQDSANEATFVFAVPVKEQDITGANVRYCVINISARAQAEEEHPDCTEATEAHGFVLQYDKITRTLTISDPKPGKWGVDNGPFRISCAACISAIEFNNLHTSDGQLLPKKTVVVY